MELCTDFDTFKDSLCEEEAQLQEKEDEIIEMHEKLLEAELELAELKESKKLDQEISISTIQRLEEKCMKLENECENVQKLRRISEHEIDKLQKEIRILGEKYEEEKAQFEDISEESEYLQADLEEQKRKAQMKSQSNVSNILKLAYTKSKLKERNLEIQQLKFKLSES